MARAALAALVLASLALPAAAEEPGAPGLRDRVQAFIDEPDPAARAEAREAILSGKPPLADLAAAVAAGPRYAADAETEWLERWVTGLDGKKRAYLLYVPRDYDPTVARPMMIDLHGGVSRPQSLSHDQLLQVKFFWAEHCEKSGTFLAIPAGDQVATWWNPAGVHNILSVLREVRRTWNVDEDRVFATGFSDGGSGSFHLALAHATPFAGFIPLNGHIGVATMGGLQGHMRNLMNRPVYAVNTDQDSLYPSRGLKPVYDAIGRMGAPLVWHEVLGFRHDPSYLPEERPAIVDWMDGVVRPPHPGTVHWEGTADAPPRTDWVRVTEVPGGAGKAPFEDVNPTLVDTRMRLGVQLDPEFPGPGTKVVRVVDGSAAKAMGVEGGDVLLTLDGKEIADVRAVRGLLAAKKPGDAVSVSIRRGEREIAAEGKFPPAAEEPTFRREKPWGSLRASWKGDLVEVACAGIAAFEVWVPADRVVPGRTLRIVVNGKPAFEGIVAPDPAFLLDGAAADADRRRVYGARVAVRVPKGE